MAKLSKSKAKSIQPEVIEIERLTKAHLNALEKVYEAEINARLPFQSTAKVYKALEAIGYVEHVMQTWQGVTVAGWYLTHAGRITLCINYEHT